MSESIHFLGYLVRNAAGLMAPLYDQLKGRTGKRDGTRITWSDELTAQFERVKDAFANYTLLHFLDDQYPLQTDLRCVKLRCGRSIRTGNQGRTTAYRILLRKVKESQTRLGHL